MNFQLAEGEQIVLELKPHSKAALYYFFSRTWHFAFTIILLAVLLIIRGFGDKDFQSGVDQVSQGVQSHMQWVYMGFAGLVALLIIVFFLMKAAMRGYDYVVTNQRCILSYGFLSINHRIIPYSKVVDLRMSANFFERLFGLASVYIDNTVTGLSFSRNMRATGNTCRMEGLTMDQAEQVINAINKYFKP